MNPVSPTLVAYGAAAERPTLPGITWRLREWARREYYARLALAQTRRHGHLPPLVYHDHSCDWFVNHGDVAIADTLVNHVVPRGEVPVERRNWRPGGSKGWLNEISTPATIMVCGGGYVFLDAAGKLSPRLASDLAEFRRAGAAFGLVGVGVNQLTETAHRRNLEPDPVDLDTLRGLFGEAAFASVRDVATQEYLRRATGLDIPLSGDPALFMLDPDRQTAQRPSHGGRLQVGLSLPFHGAVVDRHLNRCLPAIVAALRELQQRLNCDYHYFAHFDSERVLPRLLGQFGLRFTVHGGSVPALLQGYGQLDAHIGGMLHSCILATNHNVPLVGLAYDAKHAGLFNVLGLPEQKLDMEPEVLRELPDRIERTLQHAPRIATQLLQARRTLAGPYRSVIARARAQLGVAM
ncbi:MAG: hypothetical protein RJB26_1750 [Pseudomonadota bacterium]|jgi:polysaccharide pyruvyl transferase WcaK-like protein